MKTVFRHPPEDLTGKRYWRSLEELADTPQFRTWLEREFPAGAAEMDLDGVSRRNFLRRMVDTGQGSSVYHFDARTIGWSAADCHDLRRAPNEARRQPSGSFQQRRH